MQPYSVDERVQALLDFTEEGLSSQPINNRQFIIQSQEINRWDREPLNNEYFRRLSAEHFRSRHSCIIGNYDEEGGLAHVRREDQIKQPPRLPTKRTFMEKALPRSGYLPPRKTFTPPLNSKAEFHTNMERKQKTNKIGRSKSNQQQVRHPASNSLEKIGDSANLQFPSYLPYGRTTKVKISNFSFEEAEPLDPILVVQKSERVMIDHMKHEALMKRLRYQPSSLTDRGEERQPAGIYPSREALAVDSYVLHNFRTKKMLRNRKLQLIL